FRSKPATRALVRCVMARTPSDSPYAPGDERLWVGTDRGGGSPCSSVAVEDVDRGERGPSPDAVPKVHRKPCIAGPERTPQVAEARPVGLELRDGVHGEEARTPQPH